MTAMIDRRIALRVVLAIAGSALFWKRALADGTLYIFRLDPSLSKLQLDRSTLKWQEMTGNGKIIDSAGTVDDSYDDRLICMSDNQVVVTLIGASWAGQAGDSGNATCGCNHSTSNQTWYLVQAGV